ncbi:MAG TPA: nucleoside-diphosphate sugar epimerase/dehydratase [Sphingomonas sp.]|nr:nucleoside-diphosphate sugar epimerase/dehydratase [Sphingomonas sp.]
MAAAAGVQRIAKIGRRRLAWTGFDAVAIMASLAVALGLRMNGAIPPRMIDGMVESLPVYLLCGIATLQLMGVYDRMWRLGSSIDFIVLAKAAIVVVSAPVAILMVTGRADWLPASVPIIHLLVLFALVAGGRLLRRLYWEHRAESRRVASVPSQHSIGGTQVPVLIVGHVQNAEVVLRQIEAMAGQPYRAVGIVDLGEQDVALRLRGVPILGSVDAIDHIVERLAAAGRRPRSLLLAEGSDPLAGSLRLRLITAAETLGLAVMHATAPSDMGTSLELEAVNMADLLGRPQTRLDERVIAGALHGKRVLITGAGGTIGRELAHQIAAVRPAELFLLDAGEFNLYTVEMDMRETFPDVRCTPLLCSVRQRAAVMALFAEHGFDFVFHAAALKHVPLVELNPAAGVLTNVIGTRNVADAASRHGVTAMVQVSSDKAVNPVGVMGATKRLGELYCQALDLQGAGRPGAARFMTVRFGNVLGSSGSLIPLFQRQLERRVPLTVTHAEITRFFMTVHEAVQLVLHSTVRAIERDVVRGRIIVLDMGEPVKVIDIARRMIRLAGLEPDRDVPIEIIGLRPGEKLFEELFDEHEARLPSVLSAVFEAEPVAVPLARLRKGIDRLASAISHSDEALIRRELFAMLAHPASGDPVTPKPDQTADLADERVPATAAIRRLEPQTAMFEGLKSATAGLSASAI